MTVSADPSPEARSEAPSYVRLSEMPIWRVPMWLNLVLMIAPLIALVQVFGNATFESTKWGWRILGAVALAMAIFGRRYPLARVHPLAWRARPWFFWGKTGVMWLILQFSAGWGASLGYRAASLVAAAIFVLFTTTGDEDAPLYGRDHGASGKG